MYQACDRLIAQINGGWEEPGGGEDTHAGRQMARADVHQLPAIGARGPHPRKGGAGVGMVK